MKNNKLEHIKTTGFRVPDNYFEDLPNEVFSKLQSEQFPNDTGFTTPKGFFELVSDQVFHQIEQEQKPTLVKQLSLSKTIYILSGVAAAIIVVLGLFNLNSNSNELSIEMVESYVEYSNINTYELAELLIDTELLKLEDIAIEPEFNDTELENYLLDQVDLEDIISQ